MDVAALGYEIDSSQAVGAAKNLAAMNKAAAEADASAAQLTTTFRDANGRFQAASKYADLHATSIRSLAGEFNKTLAAQLAFSDGQKRLAEAVRLGVVSQENAADALAMLRARYDAVINPSARVAATYQRQAVTSGDAAGGTDNLANAMTNASFQVQDFAVQLASGQSAMMAFAQQFPQLMGSLGFAGKAGLYGALIGTAAAVGVTLYQAFGSATENAKSLDDVVGDLDSSFAALSDYMRVSAMDTIALRDEFGLFADQVRGFNEYMKGIAIAESLEKSDEVIAKLRTGLDEVSVAYQNVKMAQAALSDAENGGLATDEQILSARDALALYQDTLDQLASNLGLSADQAMALRDGLNDVASSNSLGQQATEASKVLKYIEGIYGNSVNLPAPLRDTYRELTNIVDKSAKANTELAKMPGILDLAKSAAGGAATAVGNIGTAADGAIAGVQRLVDKLLEAARAKAMAVQAAEEDWSGIEAGRRAYGGAQSSTRTVLDSANPLYGGTGSVLPTTPDDGGGGSGGGGGGGTDPYAENLQRLMESLRTEQEVADAWYQENLTLLDDRRAAEILGEQAHNEAKLALEQEYLEKKRGLNDTYGAFSLDSADKLFGELYSLSGSGYDGLLKAQKAFGAASALINTYTAASQVLADPTLGFFAKFAAVAKTVAAGMGLVNAIKGGGGGGGSATATTSATNTTAAEPQRVTRVELQGDDWLVSLAESMLGQIYDASKNGRVIVARA